MATREDLHRKVDALSDAQAERARIIVVDEVDVETSVESILTRHGEQRLSAAEFEEHFGDLAPRRRGLSSATSEKGPFFRSRSTGWP
jgi:hypothetical protein